MKILIYGAGPLGSVFAVQLHRGGHEVAILARGQRLKDLREHGVVIHNVSNDKWITAQVQIVERFAPEDAYDLVLVIMRKNNAVDILPILAANRHCSNVLFLCNNAAGPQVWVDALGKERVLTGFPASAGYRDGHVVHCLTGTADHPLSIPFGEVDGQIRERTLEIAKAIDAAPGFTANIRTDMDAWHKYHVALLMPSIGPALYACGTDRMRMTRTRDALVLTLRAMREGFRVLRAKGLPLTPRSLWIFEWLPEPILVLLMRRWAGDPKMEIALVRHANAARDEVQCLAREFAEIARSTAIPTPNTEQLAPHLDPATPLIPDGSREIPLDWRGLIIGACALAGAILGVRLVLHRRHRKTQ